MKICILLASSTLSFSFPACEGTQAQDPAPTEPVAQQAAAQEAPAAGCTATQCSSAAPPASESTRVRVDLRDAPVAGRKDAPVTVVVYSDFECPFSARASTTIAELQKKYGDKVRVAFKEHPLPIHTQARPAARAALAADEQGRFWPMHDAMFGKACAVDQGSFDACAERAGLDMARYHAALTDPRLDARIDADLAEGHALGVAGTPTYFIDGRRVIGAQPLEDLSAVIDDELTR
jgi:protein-disulfide isomerase